MTHEHCDKCFLTDCLDISSCALIFCPNGCFARMHECKSVDHNSICPNAYISCLNVNYGCPLTIRRSDLTRHLRQCPASIIVCSYNYNHDFHFDNLENSLDKNLIQIIARRDNIWHEHITQFENQQKLILDSNKKIKSTPVEHLIRSGKYRYITMPECMLSKGDHVICSTCRKHLRQLEENEDQRLSELTEEERKIMEEFNLNYDIDSNESSIPSLVKMSSTLINLTDIPIPENPTHSHSDTQLSQIEPMSIISDIELPSSYIYRLNYFSSNDHRLNINSFIKSPRFSCLALCRRDEIEQHWNIHFQVDCILNTSLIQPCPKYQYGCRFEYERLEPCQITDEPIRIRFDERNDAIAFEWYPSMAEETNECSPLLDLPSEILEKILRQLDSLSLRNISLVCHRLRVHCQCLLQSHGIVVTDHERTLSSHGDVAWVERKKHWLFTNTSSAVPKWRLKDSNKLNSLNQHLTTCKFGETKELENEPPFQLPAWNITKDKLEPTE